MVSNTSRNLHGRAEPAEPAATNDFAPFTMALSPDAMLSVWSSWMKSHLGTPAGPALQRMELGVVVEAAPAAEATTGRMALRSSG